MKKERTADEIAYDLWKSIQYENSSTSKARKHKNKEKTIAHYKKLGDKNAESGHMKNIAPLGGKTVTPKKLETIQRTGKERRTLTDEQVLEMKEIYKNDLTIGLSELSDKYGMSRSMILMILTNEQYSDVGEPVDIREPLIKCEHCKDPQTKGNYERWHGEKCNLKGIDVDGIVSEYKQGGISIPKLAKKYGLTIFKTKSVLNKNK